MGKGHCSEKGRNGTSQNGMTGENEIKKREKEINSLARQIRGKKMKGEKEEGGREGEVGGG